MSTQIIESSRSLDSYRSFDHWFLANVDADTARGLREHGAVWGVSAIKTHADAIALFNVFEDAIEQLATDYYQVRLWKIAKASDSHRISNLQYTLVMMAIEQLAHILEPTLEKQRKEADAALAVKEGAANEN
jgi:hypothetical protein